MKIQKRQAWKKISRRLVYKSKFLLVYKDEVKIPNKEGLFEYFLTKKSDIVVIVAKTKNNKIIMIEEYKYATGKYMLVLPAGHIEKNENIIDAAKRELLEETGYSGDDFTYCQKIYESPVQDLHKVKVVVALDVKKEGKPKLEATEDIRIKLMTANEIKTKIKKGEITSCSTLSSLVVSGFLGI